MNVPESTPTPIRKLDNAFARNNAVSVFLMGALPAVAGSATSFMLASFFGWGLLSLLFCRFKPRLTRNDCVLAGTFTAFAALILLTALLGKNPSAAAPRLVWLLPFLSAWAVIPRLRASPQLDYIGLYVTGAAIGAIGALVSGLLQFTLAGLRPEGGAGNPAVYGILALCLAAIGSLQIDSPHRDRRFLAVAGTLAGLSAMVLSGTRGAMLAAVPVVAVGLIYAPRSWRVLLKPRVLFFVAIALALVLFFGWDFFANRLKYSVKEIGVMAAEGYSPNVGERLRLWRAGWSAFLEAPFLGHGIQNRMAAISEVLAREGLPPAPFSHAHNALITFGLDGGLAVLAALVAVLVVPIAIARRAPQDTDHRRRFFLALLVTLTYIGCGMTQIMFNHDILDSLYIFSAIVVAVSIGTATPGRAAVAGASEKEGGVASGVGDAVFGFVEIYFVPVLLAVLGLAGIIQSFLSPAMKGALRAWIGF